MSDEIETIDASELQAPGVIIDKQGNKWTIPANEFDDDSDSHAINPFGNLKYDPEFHYQIVGEREIPAKMTQGFVPVTREEVGLSTLDTIERQFGTFAATNVVLDTGALMKIPKVLADRRQRRKEVVARKVREATEPSPEQLARAKRTGPRLKSAASLDQTIGSGAHYDTSLKHRVSNRISE